MVDITSIMVMPVRIISSGVDKNESENIRQANEQIVIKNEIPRRCETLSIKSNGL